LISSKQVKNGELYTTQNKIIISKTTFISLSVYPFTKFRAYSDLICSQMEI